jgi:hypothetical protein
MAKKPRSQRRKKSKNLDDDDDDEVHNNEDDMLGEDHTIADSMTTAFSVLDDTDFFGEDENDLIDTDDLLGNRVINSGSSNSVGGASLAVAAKREGRLQDVLFGLDEFASEKSSAKREGRLKRLFKALTQCAVGPSAREAVFGEQEHIRTACLYALRNGQGSEQYAACRCLEAASVVLGANQDEWVESLDKYLCRTVMMTTKATLVRVAALRALSMSVFICSDDTETTEGLMDLTELVAGATFRNQTTPLALRATGLDCWALLATTLHDFYLSGQDDTQIGRGLALLSLLDTCLESTATTSIDLRSAAGECLALIHEARLNLGVGAGSGQGGDTAAAEDSLNVTARQFQRGSWDGSEWEELIDQVKQRIAQLSVESDRHMGKKAKKEQRATFREFMATIVDDEAPCEVVCLLQRNAGSSSLTLDTWREIIQLNFIRHCLQGGF